VASATNDYVQFGKAGPFTLYTRCRISGGTVDAYLAATGPSLTFDATYLVRATNSPTNSFMDSDIKRDNPTLASPMVVGNSGVAAGGNSQTVWTSALLQAGSSVAIQSWVRSETAGAGGATDSCRFSAIVTPLE
jgi:hypothetical protein